MKTVPAKPLISVCIPCYNAELYIAQTVESVLKQTFADFELVIIDDASVDSSFARLQQFTDPRIRLSRNPHNLGMGQNWNKTLSYSRGKYVKLLCGDDLLEPECLARQAAVLEAPCNSSAVLAVCGRKVINQQGKTVLRRAFPFSTGLVSGRRLIRTSVRCGSNIIGEPVVGLFRREVIDKSTQYDPSNRYLIDFAFWAEILKQRDAFVDPECLAAFRISQKAVSSQIGLAQARAFRSFVRRLRAESFYGLSRLDVFLGFALSFQWCLLRNVFVWLRANEGGHDFRDVRDQSAATPSAGDSKAHTLFPPVQPEPTHSPKTARLSLIC